MSNFRKVLNYLSTIPSELDKGSTFERYCKWFLENDPRYSMQLKKVWLWRKWPGNWGRDKGIDLIAETHNGELWAIQAKAYDENYFVTKEDVDTFLSESARTQISYRLLISTTNRIGHNAREVIAAQEKQVGICNLENLEASSLDWPLSIENPSTYISKNSKTLRPHQERALQDIVLGFEKSHKGQLLMACGTGKTLVGLRLSEFLKCQNTLVLVPSISLVSQIYQEWSNNSNGLLNTFYPIFVCSDPTVSGSDQMIASTSELGFPVTTNAREIVRNFSSNTTPKVIFSTYHSSPVIAEACRLDQSMNFDLTISDEAHRCTGSLNSEFTTVVKSDAIRTTRKLFMTATPKIFSDHVKQKTKELEYEIISMDDQDKFGPVFHKLSFSEAIKLGLLSDYQVLISVMDNKTYREYADKGRFVAIDKHETDARTLASQLLVAKAINKFGLKRIISFHSRKKSAQEFVDTFSKVIPLLNENEKPEIEFYGTIFGDMQQGKRQNIMKQFKGHYGESSSLLANVKCLSEGIDVPTLDGVAFIDPKGSEIDIVQAVGRAIRKPDKSTKIGTIIIPIFVDNAANEEIALEQSCFKTVWSVVKALRAHDDVLAEELDNLRLELGKKTFRMPVKLGKITIDVPVAIGLAFSESLMLKMVENCSSSWNFQINLLKEFRLQYPNEWPKQNDEFPPGNDLGRWCSDQRKNFKNGKLDHWKIESLNSMGFIWNPWSDKWDEQLNNLKEFRQLHPDRWPKYYEEFPIGNKLGVWCGKQRNDFKNDKLPQKKVTLLESLGFEFNRFEVRWFRQFNYLKDFRRIFSNKWPTAEEEFPPGNNLGGWCADQRANFKNDSLIPSRKRLLSALGFEFTDLTKTAWLKQLDWLKKFRLLHPDRWPITKEIFPSENKLGIWCSMQREAFKKGQLSADKIALLETLGFEFNLPRAAWIKRFNNLENFRKEHPDRWPTQDEEFPPGNKLGGWCSDQRKKFKKSKLAQERKAKLDGIGFQWIVKS